MSKIHAWIQDNLDDLYEAMKNEKKVRRLATLKMSQKEKILFNCGLDGVNPEKGKELLMKFLMDQANNKILKR